MILRRKAMTPPPVRGTSPAELRRNSTTTETVSHHVQLPDRPACGYPFITEGRESDRAIAAMHDQFGDGAADGGRLLDAVAAKAGGEDQALDRRMPADDAVLVEGVVFVVARPAIHHLGRLEGRRARGQGGPHHVVPFLVLDFERRAGGIVAFGRRRAADIEAALRPEPGARGVDDERRRSRRLAHIEHEHRAPTRLDRQGDAGQRGYLPRPGAPRQHDRAALPPPPGAQGNGGRRHPPDPLPPQLPPPPPPPPPQNL